MRLTHSIKLIETCILRRASNVSHDLLREQFAIHGVHIGRRDSKVDQVQQLLWIAEEGIVGMMLKEES